MMKIGTGAIFVQLIPLPRRTPRENRSRPYFRGWSICVVCYFFLAVTTAPAAHAFDITVEVGKPANVSTAIYDSQGRMVRELARALPLPAGQQTLTWDGLDMAGRPAAAGD